VLVPGEGGAPGDGLVPTGERLRGVAGDLGAGEEAGDVDLRAAVALVDGEREDAVVPRRGGLRLVDAYLAGGGVRLDGGQVGAGGEADGEQLGLLRHDGQRRGVGGDVAAGGAGGAEGGDVTLGHVT